MTRSSVVLYCPAGRPLSKGDLTREDNSQEKCAHNQLNQGIATTMHMSCIASYIAEMVHSVFFGTDLSQAVQSAGSDLQDHLACL